MNITTPDGKRLKVEGTCEDCYESRNEIARLRAERAALQRRVEALEKSGAALVAKIAALRSGEKENP